MDNTHGSSIRRLSRKLTSKRDSHLVASMKSFFLGFYQQDQLKMIAMLGLIKKFIEHKVALLNKFEQETEDRLRQTNEGKNKNSCILTMQPLKKEIISLNQAAIIMEAMGQFIEKYLVNMNQKQKLRRSCNVSTLSIGLTTPTDLESTLKSKNSQAIKVLKEQNDNQLNIIPKNNEIVQLKDTTSAFQNASHHNTHRRYWSDLFFLTRKSSPIKQLTNGERRQKLFMLKKKQELKFIRKITVDFNSKQAQFKALVEMMALFLRNLNRSNYYLKMIDQNVDKCQQINIYIKELIKNFDSIIEIYIELSKTNKALHIKKEKMVPICELDHFAPLVRQYYEKSNQTIKIMRHFSLSPVFQASVMPFREQCSKLVHLFVEARYTLRYLEKQIENLEPAKKENSKLPKWQKAYRLKFLPKHTIF